MHIHWRRNEPLLDAWGRERYFCRCGQEYARQPFGYFLHLGPIRIELTGTAIQKCHDPSAG